MPRRSRTRCRPPTGGPSRRRPRSPGRPSRRHAEFRRESDGYRVRDVGSLNGTYVNRERTDDAPLVPGDEVQIGKFQLVFFSSDEHS